MSLIFSRQCSGKNPCSVHEKWAGVRESIDNMLVGKNIVQMAKDMKKPRFRSS